MENIEKISDDLYVLKFVHREGTFVGITISLGKEKIGLIDAGFEATITNCLFPFLQELGRSPDEIDLVVITHRDRDHVEGSKILKEKTRAKIAIHELDADAIEAADIKLRDGQHVELGDRCFEVVHAPGHTPGNICLYQKEEQLLIIGDTLVGERVQLMRMGKDPYINSIKKLMQLDVKLLIQSHPREPIGKAILVDEEPKEQMRASIEFAEKAP